MENVRQYTGYDKGVLTIIFDIEPKPAPRMTRNSLWKFKPYFVYKDYLRKKALENGFELPEVIEDLTFVFTMPKSWSGKKRAAMINTPHKQRPDLDNLVKSFKDAICENDEYVHTYKNICKVWGEKGCIIIALSKLKT